MNLQPTVLIVDDEKHTRDGLRSLLENDYDVYVAPDIAGAIDVLDREQIDVLLTDLRLGSRSYLDLSASMNVTEKIRARFGANNLLDKDPPINGGNACPAGPCNGNTWPTFYDATGRFIFFNVSAEF